MFCTKCGTKLEENASFCHNCGMSAANNTSKTEYASSESYTVNAEFAGDDKAANCIDSDVCAFIGEEKQVFYTEKFAEMKKGNKKVTWNWCAFLFGPAWMIYRKMYVYGALYWLAAAVLLDRIAYLDIAASVLAGVFGNYIYMTYLEKQAVAAKALNEPAKSQFVEKNKGTSFAAVAICMGIVFTVSFVGNLLLGGFFGL